MKKVKKMYQINFNEIEAGLHEKSDIHDQIMIINPSNFVAVILRFFIFIMGKVLSSSYRYSENPFARIIDSAQKSIKFETNKTYNNTDEFNEDISNQVNKALGSILGSLKAMFIMTHEGRLFSKREIGIVTRYISYNSYLNEIKSSLHRMFHSLTIEDFKAYGLLVPENIPAEYSTKVYTNIFMMISEKLLTILDNVCITNDNDGLFKNIDDSWLFEEVSSITVRSTSTEEGDEKSNDVVIEASYFEDAIVKSILNLIDSHYDNDASAKIRDCINEKIDEIIKDEASCEAPIEFPTVESYIEYIESTSQKSVGIISNIAKALYNDENIKSIIGQNKVQMKCYLESILKTYPGIIATYDEADYSNYFQQIPEVFKNPEVYWKIRSSIIMAINTLLTKSIDAISAIFELDGLNVVIQDDEVSKESMDIEKSIGSPLATSSPYYPANLFASEGICIHIIPSKDIKVGCISEEHALHNVLLDICNKIAQRDIIENQTTPSRFIMCNYVDPNNFVLKKISDKKSTDENIVVDRTDAGRCTIKIVAGKMSIVYCNNVGSNGIPIGWGRSFNA